jgi:two-component system, NtrC family, response regulator AtoC
MSVGTIEIGLHAVRSGARITPQLSGPDFIGESAAVIDLLAKINIVAKSQVPVLITGETGTGKEIIARLIHARSSRCKGAFVVVNSAAIPKDVVENELFGHEKEAFTGAISKRAGCFEQAHDGTLFLDEIAEMHTQTQAKLLRAIENKSFRRLGGGQEVFVESRIVAATNRDITSSLKSGEFREDLYYRLSVIEIALPPLRDRREDIDLLVEHFNELLSVKYRKPIKRFQSETLEMLREFDWPGNVRELKNVVERLVLVHEEEKILPTHLPTKITGFAKASSSVVVPIGTTSKNAELMLIRQTLASVQNNKSAAARILGLTRKTLHAKLSRG